MKQEVTVTRSGFAAVPFWVADALVAEDHKRGTVWLVYVTLCRLANWETRMAVAGWDKIVEATGLSKSTVMRDMALLRKVGAIVRQKDVLFLPLDKPAVHSPGPNIGTSQSQYWDQPVPILGPVPYIHSISEQSAPLPETNPPAPPAESPAQRLAVLAYEQTPKPVTPFIAVRKRAEALLAAGYAEDHVAAAIESGNLTVWTSGGCELGMQKTPPPRPSADAPTPELLAAAREWDAFFDADPRPPVLPTAPRPILENGNWVSATGRQYRIVDRNRDWVAPIGP